MVPFEYQQARIGFYDFLTYARDQAGFQDTHPVYTMAQGVLQALRRQQSPPANNPIRPDPHIHLDARILLIPKSISGVPLDHENFSCDH